MFRYKERKMLKDPNSDLFLSHQRLNTMATDEKAKGKGTPIIRRAISDAKRYIEEHLTGDFLPFRDEGMRTNRITELDFFVSRIDNAITGEDSNGTPIPDPDQYIIDYYRQGEANSTEVSETQNLDFIKEGYFSSNLRKLLKDGYDSFLIRHDKKYKRTEVSKVIDVQIIEKRIIAINEQAHQSPPTPIVNRALDDINKYFSQHLLGDRLNISGKILNARCLELNELINTVKNAIAEGGANGNQLVISYYSEAKDMIICGKLPSKLECLLKDSYDNFIGNQNINHSRNREDITSTKDPFVAQKFTDIETKLRELNHRLEAESPRAITDALRRCRLYLNTLVGENEKKKVKDYLYIRGSILKDRLEEIGRILDLAEACLNHNQEDFYTIPLDETICPISHEIRDCSLNCVTPSHSSIFSRPSK